MVVFVKIIMIISKGHDQCNLIKCLTADRCQIASSSIWSWIVTTLLAACVDSSPPVTAAKPKPLSCQGQARVAEVTIGDDNITFKQLEREPPSEIALQALVDAGLSTPPPEVEQPTIVSELPPAVIEDDDLQTSLREIEESGQMVSAIINELEQETDGDNASIHRREVDHHGPMLIQVTMKA